MNRKLYSSLTVVAVAFALVLGFGGFNVVKAAPIFSGEGINPPAGAANLIGDDEANNSVAVVARDSDFRADKSTPYTYGLHDTSTP